MLKTCNGPSRLCNFFYISFSFYGYGGRVPEKHFEFFFTTKPSLLDLQMYLDRYIFISLSWGPVRVMAPESIGAVALLHNVELVSCSANAAASKL